MGDGYSRATMNASTTAACLGFLMLCGCAAFNTSSKQTTVMQELSIDRVTARELRVKVYELAGDYAGATEDSVDHIIAQTSDRAVRSRALQWKINATSQVYKVAFRGDPLGALVDTWTLSLQLRAFYEKGAGAKAFGANHGHALQMLQQGEHRIGTFAKSIMPHETYRRTEKLVQDFAKAHPISSYNLNRQSVATTWHSSLEPLDKRAAQAMVDMEEAVMALSDRMRFYADYLPKQTKWQAQLVIEETLIDLVQHERQAMMSSVHDEVSRMLTDVERQRLSAFDDLNHMRASVTKTLATERQVVLDSLHREREDAVTQTHQAADQLVDRIFKRALRLLIIFMLGEFALVIVSLFIWRAVRRTNNV